VKRVKLTKRKTITKIVKETEAKPFELPTIKHKPDDDSQEDTDNDGLTMRRRLFVDAITGQAMGNGTKAARLAGYKDDNENALAVTASFLLRIPKVQQAIARKIAARNCGPERVKANIAALAEADISNFVVVDDEGKANIDWKAAAQAGAIGQIREWVEDVIQTPDGNCTVLKRRFKLYDRTKALELLARMNGQLTNKVDVTSGGKAITKLFMDVDDGDESGSK